MSKLSRWNKLKDGRVFLDRLISSSPGALNQAFPYSKANRARFGARYKVLAKRRKKYLKKSLKNGRVARTSLRAKSSAQSSSLKENSSKAMMSEKTEGQ
jgi:hypothetical protein